MTPLIHVRDGETAPMVCSSIVWLAVQLVNDRAATAVPPYPPIIQDGRPPWDQFAAGGEYGSIMCRSSLTRKAGKRQDRRQYARRVALL